MKNLAEMKVGEIVASNFRASKVFTAHGIDFCCKGGVTLKDTCSLRNISMDQVMNELEELIKTSDSYDYDNLDLKELINVIINSHHKYIENTIPVLKTYLDKLSKVHGELHPELHEIRKEFFMAADALTVHMKKEELILFPYIRAMVDAEKGNFPLAKPHFGDIYNPIKMMEEDHDIEGERFRKISAVSGNYSCPPDGCQTYKVTYALLREFEMDLHKHIHLENNILFPKAKEMFSAILF